MVWVPWNQFMGTRWHKIGLIDRHRLWRRCRRCSMRLGALRKERRHWAWGIFICCLKWIKTIVLCFPRLLFLLTHLSKNKYIVEVTTKLSSSTILMMSFRDKSLSLSKKSIPALFTTILMSKSYNFCKMEKIHCALCTTFLPWLFCRWS